MLPKAVPKFFGLIQDQTSSDPREKFDAVILSIPFTIVTYLVTTEMVSSSHSIRSSNCYHSVFKNLNQLLQYLTLDLKKECFLRRTSIFLLLMSSVFFPLKLNSAMFTTQGIIKCLQLWFVHSWCNFLLLCNFDLFRGLVIQMFGKTHFTEKWILGTLTQ